MVARLDHGQVWGNFQGGILCLPAGALTWRSGRLDVKTEDLDDVFREEMHKAGFVVEGNPDNLFEQPRQNAEYAVAGSIKNIRARICAPLSGYGDVTDVKGAAVMDIEWQIYSRLQQAVIATVKTTGGFEIRSMGPGNFDNIIFGAFAQNVKGLIVSAAFRNTFIGASVRPDDVASPGALAPIEASLAPGHGPPVSINDATGSVVLIFAGDAQGSGFLVSSEGYVLTDRHVVGDAKYVKVRWSDGISTLGEVVRSDKTRDVALVKTDPRGRQPLVIRRDPAQPGETVFAIGAPLDEKFQNTVTRGIVSANRTFDGLRFIQSDVSVNPGSSGGPLLDEKGQVLGLTESGYRLGSAPVSINLFTPAPDALDFLALRSRLVGTVDPKGASAGASGGG